MSEHQTEPDASPAPLHRDTERTPPPIDHEPHSPESHHPGFPPGHPGNPPRLTARVAIPDDGLANGAGEIVNLIHGGIGGTLSVLWSRAGSYRASHHHREDDHYLYVLEGEVRYFERAVGSTVVELEETFVAGEMFYTPPDREHLLIFTAPTIMISASSRSRTHEEHEADVVRVPRESWGV